MKGRWCTNFCGHTYDYEKLWATGFKPHVMLQLFNRNWYSRFIFHAKTRILPVLRTIGAIPRRIGRRKEEAET